MSETSPTPPKPPPGPSSAPNPSSGSRGGYIPPAPPGPAFYGMAQPAPPARSGTFSRIVIYLLAVGLLVSITINVYLSLIVGALTSDIRETIHTRGDTKQRVVIIPVDGVINAGVEEFVVPVLRRLKADPPKAVVLRVDSPGGDPFVSDRIWNALRNFRKETGVPVVASFGGMAASGGYYISAGSDLIIAEPSCITGSIGVMSIRLNPEGLFRDILKIEPYVQTSSDSPRKDVGNHPFRFSEDDRDANQRLLDTLDAQFKHVVRQGRPDLAKHAELFEAATSGQAFSAQTAMDNGLIDVIGYLDDAIEKAAVLAEIPDDVEPHVVVVRRPVQSLLRSIIGVEGSAPSAGFPASGHELQEMLLETASWRFEYRWYPGL
ncbi:MAG: S49 family peptidase [Phycisphaeraceae bacterium]|nr:S49 family peptidase [Phycisphaeraceae bacterium]